MVSLLNHLWTPSEREVAGDGSTIAIAQNMLQWRGAEKDRLNKIHDYWNGTQAHPFAPRGAPEDVKRLALMSRVNILDIVIAAVSQTLYVDGYRQENQGDEAPAWAVWQANKLDAEQSGVHDAALAYGASYVTVLPGNPTPVIKGHSPRFMTALLEDDPDWQIWGLEATPYSNEWTFRLFDAVNVYTLSSDSLGGNLQVIGTQRHNIGVTPIVRFRNKIDLDGDNRGEIEPLMQIQDQVDHTTFGLKVAEHFGAFRQRYIIGWLAESEEQALKVSAQRILTFDDAPGDIQVGEFGQTSLDGYLDSRESAIRYASVIAQVPPHYLLGQMVNLSAEALVASEASLMRKSRQRQHSFGESWEQVLALAGRVGGYETSDTAQVRWADTESRAFSATVDALTKLHSLGVPIELILERIPGFTQQDVERATALIQSGSPLDNLAELFRQQETDGDV